MNKNFQHLDFDDFLEALDFMPIGMSITDDQLRLRYCNAAFQKILDFPDQLITPATTMETLFRFNAERGDYGPGDVEELVQTRLKLSMKFEPHQFFRTRNDGSIIQIIGRVMHGKSGQLIGFVSLYEDVTKEKTYERELEKQHLELSQAYDNLKQTQLQLLQSEKMASVGHLAAGIAHEINTPIGFALSDENAVERYVNDLLALITHYEQLESHFPELLNKSIQEKKDQVDLMLIREDVPQLLNEIRQGLTRVKDIVCQLKVFAFDTPDANTQVNLRELLDRALEVAIHGFSPNLIVQKNYTEIPLLSCRASEISQMFLAILTNAGQAIAGEGTISLNIYMEGQTIHCDIADTGVGIKPEEIPHIFDPFFTTRPVGSGTGMGLAMAYSTIKRQGGSIEVSSTLGQGSCFSIRLPTI
ncbi:MAG: PAS-domain containing protein [Burkholderiales bacterium]|nr:PAS-domain containing protein [Burkholderiales bacterium]